MTDLRLAPEDAAASHFPHAKGLLGAAALAAFGAVILPGLTFGLALAATAVTLSVMAALIVVIGYRRRLVRQAMRRVLEVSFGSDDAPVALTDGTGALLWQNESAGGTFAERLGQSVADPRETLQQMCGRALAEGRAGRCIKLSTGACLNAERVGRSDILWRFDATGAAAPESAGLDKSSTVDFDGLPVPLIEIDEDGVVSVANSAARALLEISETERVELYRLVEGLGRPISDWVDDAFDGRTLQKPEVVRAVRAEADRFVQITLDTIPRAGGTRLMAILNDATELKTLEAQFVQSQKMEAIGQLAGGIAHDFNNLLTAITGHCDLLLLRHDPGDPDFSDLDQINQNANRAASLVRQLLAYSRKQNLRPEHIDLRDVLSDLTHLLNRLVGERVALSFRHRRDLKSVRADRRQFEQVIMNLVVNARDAMPNGGRISVETDQEQLVRPLCRDRVEVPPGHYVVVRVADHGTGIPPDRLEKIFEPFFTTKRPGEGTGLGLSTVYGIVKQTGGYIFVDSEVGVGTTFSLYLPALEKVDSEPAPASPPAPMPPDRKAGVVLLVEDELSVRAFASRALQIKGFAVLEADSAEAALDILADKDLTVDVFLTDVIMPGRDGPSWVTEALIARPDTAVIFMSGYAEESFSERQAELPQSSFLPKPFSLADLISMVSEKMP